MLLRKLTVTLLMLLTFLLSPVHAQPQDSPGPGIQDTSARQGSESQQSQASQSLAARDIRVVVDISGSMKLNDPDNLRRPAVRLLARLLPEDTSAGLWTFGQMVNMLVRHDAVSDPWRETMVERSQQINSVAQRTNLGEAIAKASDPWLAPNQSLEHTHMILLSDGKVDISPSTAANDRERERILQELVPQLARDGLTIHTIALSAEADLDLLGAVADMTGGSAHVADSAEELSRIFADALGQAVKSNEVPLEDNRFQVDEGVEEFTALIFSSVPVDERHLELVTPQGGRIAADSAGANVRWAREPGYDLITISEPAAGEWQVEGVLGEGSRVTVVSNLRLAVAPIPARFELGDEVVVEASFHEDETRITDQDFLGVIEVTLSLTTEDGRSGSRVLSGPTPPVDGIYRDTIAHLDQPGQYLLEIVADGGTFSRKYRQTVTLISPAAADDGSLAESASDTAPETMPLLPEDIGVSQPGPAPEPSAEPPVDSERGSGPGREADTGPIDLALVEEPVPAKERTPVDEAADANGEPSDPVLPKSTLDRLISWWPWFIAALGVLVMFGLGIWFIRRRKQDNGPITETDSQEPPVVSPVASEPEVEHGDEPVPDSSEEPEGKRSDDETEMPASESEDEPEPEPESQPPMADLMVDEIGSEEPERVAEEDVPETSRDQDPGLEDFDDSLLDEEDTDGEFGLEDFDLTDIDDLPDLDTEDEGRKGMKSENKDGDKKE